MGQKRFIVYLFVQILVIAAVVIIFKINKDIKLASVEAGALFVVMPVALMMSETLKTGFDHLVWLIGMMQFWLLFALPIIGMRLTHWDSEFQDLSFLGVSGPTLHFWSNKSYLLMMAVTAWQAWKCYKKKPA